jgi:F-type H+-transporting ATPase subunit a
VRRILPAILLCVLLTLGAGIVLAEEEGHGAQEPHPAGAQATESHATEAPGAVPEGTTSHEAEPAGGEHEGGGGPLLELPDLLHTLQVYFGGPSEREANFIDYLASWKGNIFALFILLLVCTLLIRGAARKEMIPGPFQNAVETFVEGFYNFIQGILGHHAKEFLPFLGTLFLYIWFMNLSGLVPMLKAPTSLFETTLSLAICVFLYVHYTGLRRLGPLGYVDHLAGSPRDGIGWAMVPLMLPLHIIGEIAKPVSLSLRLFGNIMGEDVLIAAFTGLGVMSLAALGLPIGIPLEFPFIFLGLLLSTIQALVFTLLSAIYFSQMLPHEEEHAHH